jgi:1-acyl-sn-glycerol-3-phosphate acyltransferase
MKYKPPKRTLSIIIRSCIVWVTMSLLVLPYALLSFVLYTVNVRTRHKIISTWGRIFSFLVEHVCKIKFIVTGIENLPKTPSIIASNHQSAFETFTYVSIFPQHVWILKRELIRIPIFGWALNTVYPIAINRENKVAASAQILRQGVRRIRKGFWILVFPEGTRANPGTILPFKTGVARMAQNLKIPVVPVAHNAGFCMPRRSFFLYPGTVEIIIDKPIMPVEDETVDSLIARIETTVRNNFAKLSR